MVKRILPILLVILVAAAFRPPGGAVITFDDMKYNFGFIHQGDVVTHEFTFTNSGDDALIISDATVECKCTTVEFPKEPIAKGAKGTIKVTFDSKAAIDRQERTVTVVSNATDSPATLTFKCVVLKAKAK